MEEGAQVGATPGSATPGTRFLDLQQDAGPDGDATIFAQLSKNPFFTAGFGLAILGTALNFARKGALQGASLLRRRLLVDVEITRHDKSYDWFLRWMTAYQRQQLSASTAAPQNARLLTKLLHRFTPGLHHLSVQTSSVQLPSGASQTQFALVPGPGQHILRYGNAFIGVTREREKGPLDPQGKPFETVKLTTLYAHRYVFDRLFKEAYALSQEVDKGTTTVLTPHMTYWQPLGHPKRKRPLASVILAEGVKEHIVTDVDNFLKARQWYQDRGIPYRRGYLLHGSPGTGKSSFIQALAGYLDFNVAMLSLSERGMTDDRLMHLLINVPPQSLVVLEDADAAFGNRRTQTDDDGYRGANVTFSGLLNALDGVASAEERIAFLTTNHIDRLDPALIRPGRVDMMIRMGEASEYQITQLWQRFFGDQDTDGKLANAFTNKVRELGLIGQLSTAVLQGYFLFHKEDVQSALENVNELLPSTHTVASQAPPSEGVRG